MATKQQLTDLALEALADGSFDIASKLAAMARDADVKPKQPTIQARPAQLELAPKIATDEEVRTAIIEYVRSVPIGDRLESKDVKIHLELVMGSRLDRSLNNEASPRSKWHRQQQKTLEYLSRNRYIQTICRGGHSYIVNSHP